MEHESAAEKNRQKKQLNARNHNKYTMKTDTIIVRQLQPSLGAIATCSRSRSAQCRNEITQLVGEKGGGRLWGDAANSDAHEVPVSAVNSIFIHYYSSFFMFAIRSRSCGNRSSDDRWAVQIFAFSLSSVLTTAVAFNDWHKFRWTPIHDLMNMNEPSNQIFCGQCRAVFIGHSAGTAIIIIIACFDQTWAPRVTELEYELKKKKLVARQR